MKCPNCGFISFKSLAKCTSCGTKLGKADRGGVLVSQESQTFSIFAAPAPSADLESVAFAAPAPSVDIESIADEMKEIFTAPHSSVAVDVAEEETSAADALSVSVSGQDAEDGTELDVSEPDTFDLDLSDMTAETAVETSEPGAIDPSLLSTSNAGTPDGIHDAIVVGLNGEEEAPDLEIEGLGFESSDADLALDEGQTDFDHDQIPAEPGEDTATNDVEIDFEPEPETKPAEDAAPEASPEPVTGDVEFDLDSEFETKPAEDAAPEASPEPVTGDVEFDLDSELEIEPAEDAAPEASPEPVTGDVEFDFDSELEIEPAEGAAPPADADETENEIALDGDIEPEPPEPDLNKSYESDDEDDTLDFSIEPDEDKN